MGDEACSASKLGTFFFYPDSACDGSISAVIDNWSVETFTNCLLRVSARAIRNKQDKEGQEERLGVGVRGNSGKCQAPIQPPPPPPPFFFFPSDQSIDSPTKPLADTDRETKLVLVGKKKKSKTRYFQVFLLTLLKIPLESLAFLRFKEVIRNSGIQAVFFLFCDY